MAIKTNKRCAIPLRKFWVTLICLYILVMILTLLKDDWLTGNKPNPFFYLFVPTLSIVGGVLSMYGVAKLGKQSIQFLNLLAISLGVNMFMQIIENITKLIYYLVWEYPGWLYLILVLVMGFILMVYSLTRWGKIRMWKAVLFAVADFIGSLIVVVTLTEIVGITTPGS